MSRKLFVSDSWSERQDSNLRPDGPKPPALSTAPRPDVLNYTTNALFLQVVKSVVKTFCWCFFEKGNTRKSQCFQGFSAFLKTHSRKLPARSQTSRATNCATPRSVIFIRFLVNFRKWSNLWSKHFVGVFLKRQTAEKVSVYKGVFSMIARLFVALLFARSAFLPAGASPLPACSQSGALPLAKQAWRTHPDKY